MPVTNTEAASGPFAPDGVVTTFGFTFKAMSANEVRVVRRNSLGLDYPVQGYRAVAYPTTGGLVTFDTPPAAGDPLYIKSAPAFEQQITFPTQGAFAPQALVEAFDRAATRDIFLKQRLERIDGTLPLAPNLREDLADQAGAAMVGVPGGGTVQEVVPKKGRATAIAGSKMKIERVYDDPARPLENQAGIWPGKVETFLGINKVFGPSDGGVGAPSQAVFIRSENNGSSGDIVGATVIAVAESDNAVVFGGNIIAASSNRSGSKLVGLEIDIEPSVGDTNLSPSSGGLFINVFSKALPGPAIMTGTIDGGSFNNGLILGGLAPTAAGVALQSAHQANSLFNTSAGTFTGIAGTFGNGKSRGAQFRGTGMVHAHVYMDGANNFRIVNGDGAIVFRNKTDTASLATIDDGGNFDLEAGGVHRIGGVQVVGARRPAIGDPSGGTTIDAEARAALTAILGALRTHGLIAS